MRLGKTKYWTTSTKKIDEKMLVRGTKPPKKDDTLVTGIEEIKIAIEAKPDLVLRVIAQQLDATISKPGKIKNIPKKGAKISPEEINPTFGKDDYKNRHLIGCYLWNLFREKYKGRIDEGEEKEKWNAKVHPYARTEPNTKKTNSQEGASLLEDGNACHLANGMLSSGKKKDHFWATGKDNTPNHKQIAQNIWDHIFKQEINHYDKGEKQFILRKKAGEATQQGYIEARAKAINHSVHDPRQNDPKRIKYDNIDATVKEAYFKSDIVQSIHASVIDKLNIVSEKDKPDFTEFASSFFGKKLHEHFKTLEDSGALKDISKEHLWALHNIMRTYYQKISRSSRYKRAVLNKDYMKISQILPKNKDALLGERGIMTAKERNKDISRYIRLGKMIIHAADIDTNSQNPQESFDERLDFLATSLGQTEIKTNESFVRFWRNTTALTHLTLSSWLNRKEQLENYRHYDLFSDGQQNATEDVSVKSAVETLKKAQYDKFICILFGEREFDKKSRASLFEVDDDKAAQQSLWSYVQLGKRMRNMVNHFNSLNNIIFNIKGDLLKSESPDDLTSNIIHKNDKERYTELLEFDFAVRRQAILDDFNKLKIKSYLKEGRLTPEFEQSLTPKSGLGTDESFALKLVKPSFMKSISYLKKHDNSKMEITNLELTNEKITEPSKNAAAVYLLRKLYEHGFHEWLLKRTDEDRKKDIEKAIKARKKLSTDHAEGEGLFYKEVETAINVLDFKSYDYKAIFAELSRASMQIGDARRQYNLPPTEAKRRSTWVESFKQEFFSQLFLTYLDENKLEWVYKDLQPNHEDFPQDDFGDGDFKNLDTPFNAQEDWMEQFYAWLYLLPIEDAAKLQHQLLKSIALEPKADTHNIHNKAPYSSEDIRAILVKIDFLISLYLQTQTAGFKGQEHRAFLIDNKTPFYRDQDQFNELMDYDNHEVTLAKMNRGLRKMLRFNSVEILRSIFKKHAITQEEFDKDTEEKISMAMTDLHKLRKEIKECSAKDKTDGLAAKADKYRELAEKVTLHDQRKRSVRLDDFIRVSELLMRITGRLVDYSAMWERDTFAAYLGYLYSKDARKFKVYIPNRRAQDYNRKVTISYDNNKIATWTGKSGFELRLSKISQYIDDATLLHSFYKAQKPNPKDHERGKKGNYKSKFWVGRKQIRDDFAHYNVLAPHYKSLSSGSGKGKQRNQPKLNYRINAIRSLMSYDRKLKNAVVTSIKNILDEAGFALEWNFDRDRLKEAYITPKVETHLTMLKGRDKGQKLSKKRFMMPRHSVRYTSMVKALFEMDTGGLRAKSGGRCTGEAHYPEEFRKIYKEHISQKLLDQQLS